ncbi:hypothetical protein WEI85_45825 [Actinomycetes bacterium KLBMP 9797]
MKFGAIRRIALVGALAALLAGMSGAAAVAAPAPAPAAEQVSLAAPVTGAFTDAIGGTGRVTGTFTPTRFFAEDGNVFAEGIADLTLIDSTGQTVGTATPTVTLPVSRAAAPAASVQATCQILDLVLGPLDLDLLGLVVHLDQVHLNITAESGPGNLVGNLLCAIAGLLDGPSIELPALVDLLNAILALLG